MALRPPPAVRQDGRSGAFGPLRSRSARRRSATFGSFRSRSPARGARETSAPFGGLRGRTRLAPRPAPPLGPAHPVTPALGKLRLAPAAADAGEFGKLRTGSEEIFPPSRAALGTLRSLSGSGSAAASGAFGSAAEPLRRDFGTARLCGARRVGPRGIRCPGRIQARIKIRLRSFAGTAA
ncbi:uncharacterized protein LOC112530142 [Gallus gallus]|uniref:uncharacterized protein LOC112530142 n=1 Tax=Gallus gallus TaxID=9031 RepID=UPI001AEAED83|nr:uncharacterized protein LOC112530142 [Gallus gallus]